ncbi:MAG: tetratricopeptide repeat protein [Opitutus sp.]|nr:tetratricopeptide repeat protein [Opitutus sp.]MCS6247825.1 tetratricopeptide repeat protein [Opitutus sp.]MCS6274326.1 tetratricopeptide repeat protein [Opitutus sp.]MCS6276530.1 tetratricopeptide repeat protein [Opitutus sp.]MCS6301822.1 tetratricopeptide repeat protein [Opitutus sp.]
METPPLPIGPNTSKVSPDACEIVTPFNLGRFAPYQLEKTQYATAIRLFWGRLTLWLVLLFCVAWTTVASGLFVFIKYRRGFSEVQYSHIILLPWKLDAYRHAKGEFLIKQGLAQAESQEWRAAFDLLRPGLLAVPNHLQARLMVARIYLMAGRPDITRTTLLDGLPIHGDQVDYLREVLGYFFGLQADSTVITVTQELQKRLDPQLPAWLMGSTALAYAYFNRGHYAEAAAVLAKSRLLGTPEGRFVTARIAWEKGQRAEALAQLRELTIQVPTDSEIYRTFVYYLGEEKRWGEVRRASWLRQLALPDQPAAYVDFIKACGEEGDTARRLEAEAAFYERFKDNTQALLMLAEAAAQKGRLDITQRVAERCRELKRDEVDAVLLVLRAQLETRAYQAVIEQCIDLGAAVLKWPERQRLVLGGLRAVALYGQNQEAEAEPLVRRLWETRVLPAQVLAALALQVERVGHGREARRILRQAVAVDPLNQPALVALLRSSLKDEELQDAPALIERLLTMRNPPKELLEELSRGLGSDRYLLLPERIGIQVAIAEHLRELKRR